MTTSMSRAFFGPPRTRGEIIVGTGGSALVLALLGVYIWHVGGWRGWSTLQAVVLAVVLFDLIFGIFTISSVTAKRWYHRAGARRFRLGFVIAHVFLYLVPFAALFDAGWAWTVVNGGLLVGAAAVIEATPQNLKGAVALCLTLALGMVNLTWLPLPATLAWLPVLLPVKVLLCFLVPEASLAAENDVSAEEFETTSP